MPSDGLENRSALAERFRVRIEAQEEEITKIWKESLERLSADLRKSWQEELNTIFVDTVRIGRALREELQSQYRIVKKLTILIWLWIGGLILALSLLSFLVLRGWWIRVPVLPQGVQILRTQKGTFLILPQEPDYRTEDGRPALLIERR